MNIFLAGIHGVGKTYIASQLPEYLGFTHASASQLIKNERASATWNKDKQVIEVDENQIALAKAVRNHNNIGKRLLLDGHFVLLDSHGGHLPLGVDVFEPLNLSGVILFEDEPGVIATRIYQRDQVMRDKKDIAAFMVKERHQAQTVCNELSVPLEILLSPNFDTFFDVVRRLANSS